MVEALVKSGAALAVATLGYGGTAETLFKMCVGNGIGFALDEHVPERVLFAPAYGSFMIELAEGAVIPKHTEAIHVHESGVTTEAYMFAACGDVLDLAELQDVWEGALEGVYPYRDAALSQTGASQEAARSAGLQAVAQEAGLQAAGASQAAEKPVPVVDYRDALPLTYNGVLARPRVVIPVFPGTNCEYDTAHAFKRAGAVPQTLVINNLTPVAVAESAHALAEAIKQSQILMIPGGFSGGDEPDGSAKFITAFFRSPELTEAVRELLQMRDGLALGICNGFQALVKLGLVPFGDIRPMDAACPTLTFNNIGRHQSKLVRTRVASSLSPWLSRCEVGDVHTVAISHGEGRFVADDALLAQMQAAGQIATQYVDESGTPSMNLDANPNGSVWAIEGITSPDGRVFGKMGHSERAGAGLYKNVPGNLYQPLFEGGVGYFLD